MFTDRTNPTTKVEALQELVPHILITNQAITKMSIYVLECKDEIGWMGTVIIDEDTGFLKIDDVFLFDQEVHATTTEITPEGLTSFAEDLLSQGDEGMETWNNLKMWGHSHVNMGLSPSGQDNLQMATFAENGHDWFLRLIANKKGELKIDMYDYANGVTYLDLPWMEVQTDEEKAVEAKIIELQELLNSFKEETYEAMHDGITDEMAIKVRKKVTYTPPTIHKTYAQQQAKKKQSQAYASAYNALDYDEDNYDAYSGHYTYGHYGSIDLDDNLLITDDDVASYLGKHVLLELKEACFTLNQLEKDLEEEGYVNFFTEEDLERIFRVMNKTVI